VVAHHLSTIQSADVILVVDQGRIVAQGTHADLLETSRVYRRLFETEYSAER
jgi:ABC-type multidrug transport system fused ATPase/permease subunit